MVTTKKTRPAGYFIVGLLILVLTGCGSRPTPPAPSTRGELTPEETIEGAVASASNDASSIEDTKLTGPDRQMDSVDATILAETPQIDPSDDYVTSRQCIECHQDEYASWHQTYHRTMTQFATPGAVLGDFSGQEIQSAGLKYRVFRKGDEFWAEMPDPDRMLDMSRGDPSVVPSELPLVQRRVLMTTGSHHYQTYWVGHEEFDTVLNTLPLVYLPGEKRWIPREAAFIADPSKPFRMITIWNDHCINCHSTGGNPGLQGPKQLHTTVGELGIACEACHGPGKHHVAFHRKSPGVTRDRAQMVHPDKLDHRRSSQICGQCHGAFIRLGAQGMKFAREGVQFRPGQNLHDYRHYMEFPDADATAEDHERFRKNREFYRQRWWDDGTMLAGGREYSAMLRNDCFQQGTMSCRSCHSMHDADPNDQLSVGMHGSAACTQCHTEPQYTERLADHTHHAPDSSGSDCMNCHMPHTSYALFSAIRNHTISSPNVRSSTQHGVPNACNLCHLDKTLQWSQTHLSAWFAQDQVQLSARQTEISAAVLWALQGHAAQRVIVAWHFGWSPAQEISSTDWMAAILAPLLSDPYGVIRHVAQRSLESLSGYQDLEYDFLGAPDYLEDAAARIAASAARQVAYPDSQQAHAVLIDARGRSQANQLSRLLHDRDDRPVTIKE